MKLIQIITLLVFGFFYQGNWAQDTKDSSMPVENTEQQEQNKILSDSREAEEIQKRLQKAKREAKKLERTQKKAEKNQKKAERELKKMEDLASEIASKRRLLPKRRKKLIEY